MRWSSGFHTTVRVTVAVRFSMFMGHTRRGWAIVGQGYGLGGGFNFQVPWPIARLRADRNGTSISFLWKRYDLDSDAICGVRLYRFGLRDLVQIVHTAPDCPSFLAFWSLFDDDLLLRLNELGYALLEPKDWWKDHTGWYDTQR